MIEVVNATPGIMLRFYGEKPKRTVRAVAIVEGETVMAVGGLYRESSRMVAFCNVRDEFRTDVKKRAVVKALKRVMMFAAETRAPVQALADPDIEGSEVMLRHLGFHPVEKGVWQWQA